MQHAPEQEKPVTLKSWLSIIGVVLGAFMAILDIQITNASLEEILGSLGATLSDGSWVSTSYLAAEIIIIPLSGWLCSIFSIKRYLVGTTIVFLISSICCGFSWNLHSLIFFRVMQGISGGAFIPTAFTVILRTLPPSKIPIGFALFGLTATLAPSIGPTIGGYLTLLYGWPSIFYLNIIPGTIMILTSSFTLQSEKSDLSLIKKGDWLGILFMILGLSSFIIVAEEGNTLYWFDSDIIRKLSVLSAFSIIAFIYIELTVKNPLVDLRLFKDRNFSIGTFVLMLLAIGLYGSTFIIPLYLSDIQNYNSMQIGEVIMWMGLPQLLIIGFLPKLMKIFSHKALVCFGMLLFGISVIINSQLDFLVAHDQLILTQVIRAIGQPFAMTPLTSIVTSNIPKAQSSSASALYNMLRNLAGSIGIATLSALTTNRQFFHNARIKENVSLYDYETLNRLNSLKEQFIANGSDPITAYNQALANIASIIERESFIMAYGDAFLFIGTLLCVGSLLVWFTEKPKQFSIAAH